MTSSTSTFLRQDGNDDLTSLHFNTVTLSFPATHIAQINIPFTFKRAFWLELLVIAQRLTHHIIDEPRGNTVKVVLISGLSEKGFTAGLDLLDHAALFLPQEPSLKAFQHLNMIELYQAAFTAVEALPVPVIALIDKVCFGAGVDLACCCDIRLASECAQFSIKEVDVGIAADLGTLQKIERCTGNSSRIREWAYTAQVFTAQEAAHVGFVSPNLYKSREQLLQAGLSLGATIASKPQWAIRGTKRYLNFARDHTVEEGLKSMALFNASLLQAGLSPTVLKTFTNRAKL